MDPLLAGVVDRRFICLATADEDGKVDFGKTAEVRIEQGPDKEPSNMPVYQITEHHGRRITERWIMGMPDAETALRLSAKPPFKRPAGIEKWRFIDDGLGGGALVDPNDEDHCFRADPRSEEQMDNEYNRAEGNDGTD